MQTYQGQPQPIVSVRPLNPQPLYVPRSEPHVETCRIVKPGDRDTWAEALKQLPELTGAVVPDYSNGYNAMEMPDVPHEADMRPADSNLDRKNNPSTGRRTYGAGETKRGMVRDYLNSKYGVSVGNIRSTDGMQVVDVIHRKS